MTRPSRFLFLGLILTQAAHSTEEYATRLYDVFPPAHFISGLFSQDHRVGFLIFNVSLVAFGLWCFFGPVLHERPAAKTLTWFWVLLELSNGVIHTSWAAIAGGYRPGLVTAPILAAIALALALRLRREAA